jgi:hypothetical protein
LDSKPSALPLHHQRLHKAPGARNRAKQVLTKFFLSLSRSVLSTPVACKLFICKCTKKLNT